MGASMFSCFYKRSFLPVATLLIVLGAFCGVSHAQEPAAQSPPGRVGRVAVIDGTVAFHTADQNSWQTARRNYPVTTGQAFWTEPNSHAAIEVTGNRIYLDSSTELDVTALDDATTQFSLPQGAAFVVLRSLDQRNPYEIELARGTVTLATTGRYEVIAGDSEHPSQVTVVDGSAHVSGNGFALDVRAGETAVLSGEQTVQAELNSAGPADAFVAWVEQQEEQYQDNPPSVASAMTGAAELGAYGRWARAADYGEVWFPNVPAGWAPYREGYWAWVEPWGWTWIDDEAWGFAPFHYGRWLMVEDHWAWMPGYEAADEPIPAIYAPALVAFFTAGDTCAWVPLGPGESYVPSYPVSFGYFRGINRGYVRDIGTRQNIRGERTRLHEYVNQRAVTAVPASVVSSSQRVASHARAASTAQLADARPAMGTLPVRPDAATAGVSPSVARRFGIASAALATATAQRHAPGPPIHTVGPTANAKLVPPRAVAPAAQHAPSPAPQPQRRTPALVQPGVTHHLPGSAVGQPGVARGNRAGTLSTSQAAPRVAAPPAAARTPKAQSQTAARPGPLAPQRQRQAPVFTPPSVTHHLPGSPAPQPGAVGRDGPGTPARNANPGAQAAPTRGSQELFQQRPNQQHQQPAAARAQQQASQGAAAARAQQQAAQQAAAARAQQQAAQQAAAARAQQQAAQQAAAARAQQQAAQQAAGARAQQQAAQQAAAARAQQQAAQQAAAARAQQQAAQQAAAARAQQQAAQQAAAARAQRQAAQQAAAARAQQQAAQQAAAARAAAAVRASPAIGAARGQHVPPQRR
jgi:hypothetical protein